MNRKDKLSEIISVLKRKYPSYSYYNNLEGTENRYNLGINTFAIVVTGIDRDDLKDFLNLIDEEIISPLVDKEEELPLIIPM